MKKLLITLCVFIFSCASLYSMNRAEKREYDSMNPTEQRVYAAILRTQRSSPEVQKKSKEELAAVLHQVNMEDINKENYTLFEGICRYEGEHYLMPAVIRFLLESGKVDGKKINTYCAYGRSAIFNFALYGINQYVQYRGRDAGFQERVAVFNRMIRYENVDLNVTNNIDQLSLLDVAIKCTMPSMIAYILPRVNNNIIKKDISFLMRVDNQSQDDSFKLCRAYATYTLSATQSKQVCRLLRKSSCRLNMQAVNNIYDSTKVADNFNFDDLRHSIFSYLVSDDEQHLLRKMKAMAIQRRDVPVFEILSSLLPQDDDATHIANLVNEIERLKKCAERAEHNEQRLRERGESTRICTCLDPEAQAHKRLQHKKHIERERDRLFQ